MRRMQLTLHGGSVADEKLKTELESLKKAFEHRTNERLQAELESLKKAFEQQTNEKLKTELESLKKAFVHQKIKLQKAISQQGEDMEKGNVDLEKQIDSLIMTLNFTGIEIKTTHFVDSWEGGVLVVISSFVQTKEYAGTRKFVQTIFLAPQEKGYFVLNDVLHLLDEEQVHQYLAAIVTHGNYECNLVAPNQLPEPVSDYMAGEEVQARDYVDPAYAEEDDAVDNYGIPEQQEQGYNVPEQQHVYGIPEPQQGYGIPEPQQVYGIPETQQHIYNNIPEPQQVSELDIRVDEATIEDTIVSFQSVVNVTRDPSPAPKEETVGEQPKQTYASILRLAKAQSSSVPQAAPVSKEIPVASDWSQAAQSVPQQSYTPQQSYPSYSAAPEKSNSEAVEEAYALEVEGWCIYL